MSLLDTVPTLEDTSPVEGELPPTAAIKRSLKAKEYMVRAQEAYAQAEASTLDQVRERHQAAGDRWMEMAEQQRSSHEDANRRTA